MPVILNALTRPALVLCALVLVFSCRGKQDDGPQKTVREDPPKAAPAFIGDWQGVLKTPVAKLPLIIHITHDESGYGAMLDSPAQNAFGIAGDTPLWRGDEKTPVLVLPFAALKARLALHMDGPDALAGTFHQGLDFNIRLTRIKDSDMAEALIKTKTARPQTPRPPFAYKSTAVTFSSADGTPLAGTLVLPGAPFGPPFAAVVMITGSGAQDRDETILRHKPFAVLADALAKKGIASLRVDDRGVGGSGGDFATSTEHDFAADARAAYGFLRSQVGIDPARIGYLGHSEGAQIAAMAAKNGAAPAFLVLIGGPAKPLGSVILDQISTFTPKGLARQTALETQNKIYALLRAGSEQKDLTKNVTALIVAAGASPEAASGQANVATAPWFMDALDRDPAALLRAYNGPVLALYGQKDTQVPPAIHAPLMRTALNLPASGRDVIVLDGLNHLLQPAKTGKPDEYNEIATTIDPAALARITNWVVAQTRP